MEYPEENALNIYTDGSMLSGPRRGGAGLLFIAVDSCGNEEQREEVLPGYAGATQNQMELEAPIRGLKMATGRHPPFDPARYRKIVIKTDATYVADNFGTAVSVWSRNGWTTREGKPVDNARQWKELVRLAVVSNKQGKPVTVVRVPGKKSPRTKAVDKLAKRSAKDASKRQLNPSEVRRKRTARPIDIGSVEMEGQTITIHIFKSEYQPRARALDAARALLAYGRRANLSSIRRQASSGISVVRVPQMMKNFDRTMIPAPHSLHLRTGKCPRASGHTASKQRSSWRISPLLPQRGHVRIGIQERTLSSRLSNRPQVDRRRFGSLSPGRRSIGAMTVESRPCGAGGSFARCYVDSTASPRDTLFVAWPEKPG